MATQNDSQGSFKYMKMLTTTDHSSENGNIVIKNDKYRQITVLTIFHAMFLSTIGIAFSPGLEANCEDSAYRNYI